MNHRRQALAFLGACALGARFTGTAAAVPVVTVEMAGTPRGERIWFDPIGLYVEPGTTIRFINRDPANAHTATAYHPSVSGKPLRIPASALPWNSGFLLPDQKFEVTLTVPGVYDYFCLPHELAGMVGRIVVGASNSAGWSGASQETAGVTPAALATFPSVEKVLNERTVKNSF